jgi:hypothetical protein
MTVPKHSEHTTADQVMPIERGDVRALLAMKAAQRLLNSGALHDAAEQLRAAASLFSRKL